MHTDCTPLSSSEVATHRPISAWLYWPLVTAFAAACYLTVVPLLLGVYAVRLILARGPRALTPNHSSTRLRGAAEPGEERILRTSDGATAVVREPLAACDAAAELQTAAPSSALATLEKRRAEADLPSTGQSSPV